MNNQIVTTQFNKDRMNHTLSPQVYVENARHTTYLCDVDNNYPGIIYLSDSNGLYTFISNNSRDLQNFKVSHWVVVIANVNKFVKYKSEFITNYELLIGQFPNSSFTFCSGTANSLETYLSQYS